VNDDITDQVTRSQSWRPDQGDHEVGLARDHGNQNQSFARPTASILPTPARVQNTGQPRNSSPRISRPRPHGHVVTTPPTRPGGLNPVSVPDGGSTAMMLAGAFGGLALLQRKWRA